jgi:hypothetical protein
MSQMMLFDAEFKDSEKDARTRIVVLRSPSPVGALVNGLTDLAPQDSQP